MRELYRSRFLRFPGWKKQRGQRQNINEHGEQEHKRQYLFINDPSVFLLFVRSFPRGLSARNACTGGAPLSRSGRRNSVCRRFVEDGPAAPCFLHRQNV